MYISEFTISELAIFKKLSVAEPKIYMKEILKDTEHSTLIYFPSAIINVKVWNEIETAVKEEVS